MKRYFLTALMAVLTLSAFGQAKKVAILETVDRDNKLSYGIRLMVRSNLAEAVTTTPGYEAYDRTNLDAILDEQTFQRTGYVSDEDIRKIGEMTGVQYVLVAEASYVDNGHVFITAKILDVVTARTENISSLLLGTSADQIQAGCKQLAGKLLYVEKVQEPIAVVSEKELITRVSYDEYKLGDKWMSRKEYYNYVNNRDLCIESYRMFSKGEKLQTAGWWVLGVGGASCLALGLASGLCDEWEIWVFVGVPAFVGTAAACIPLLTVGAHQKNYAFEEYNKHCAKPAVTLNLQSSQNGLGLALNF